MTFGARRIIASVIIGALALAACGGGGEGDSGSGVAAGEQLPQVADAVEVDPAADIATNLMPDVVVDNLNDRNKVNVRNYAVADTPILLWMWAPH
ncbi:MAG: hypothetical protein HKN44_00605 [Ilumatobacter sp.]|nr:hypothetical protein [Ilumatobacter sp.]